MNTEEIPVKLIESSKGLKLTTRNHGCESDVKTLYKGCVSEAVASFFLIAVGGCAATGATQFYRASNFPHIAFSFGLTVLCVAQFTGPLSGAHMNVAVSFALFLGGRTSLVRCLCFGVAQLVGFILGASFVFAIFGQVGVNSWDVTVFRGDQVFLAEMTATILLIWVIFATIDIPEAGGGKLGVFPIAMAVVVAQLFLLPIDGCSINPTASLGTAFVAAIIGKKGEYLNQQYVFCCAPMVGVMVAVYSYDYFLSPKAYTTAIHKDSTRVVSMMAKEEKDLEAQRLVPCKQLALTTCCVSTSHQTTNLSHLLNEVTNVTKPWREWLWRWARYFLDFFLASREVVPTKTTHPTKPTNRRKAGLVTNKTLVEMEEGISWNGDGIVDGSILEEEEGEDSTVATVPADHDLDTSNHSALTHPTDRNTDDQSDAYSESANGNGAEEEETETIVSPPPPPHRYFSFSTDDHDFLHRSSSTALSRHHTVSPSSRTSEYAPMTMTWRRRQADLPHHSRPRLPLHCKSLDWTARPRTQQELRPAAPLPLSSSYLPAPASPSP